MKSPRRGGGPLFVKTSLAVLLLVAAGLTACEFFASRGEPAPGQIEVVIYRPGRLVAITNRYPVAMDGSTLGELTNGSYMRLYAAPGAHHFSITDLASWSDTLQADRRYYLQLNVSGRAPKFELSLQQVAPELAEAELEGLHEVELAKPE